MSFYLAVELRQHSVAVNVLCPGPPGPRGPTRSPRRARRGLGIRAGEPPDGMVGRRLSRVRVLARSIPEPSPPGSSSVPSPEARAVPRAVPIRTRRQDLRPPVDRPSATPAVPLTRLCCALACPCRARPRIPTCAPCSRSLRPPRAMRMGARSARGAPPTMLAGRVRLRREPTWPRIACSDCRYAPHVSGGRSPQPRPSQPHGCETVVGRRPGFPPLSLRPTPGRPGRRGTGGGAR
jgi:hypothetical protein